MQITFRKLTPSDIDACLGIMKENYPAEYEKHWEDVLPKDLSDILNQVCPSGCLLALLDEAIIGFGCYSKYKEKTNAQENIWGLTWVNISPLQQGKGIGIKLIKELERTIKQYDTEKFHIVLETTKPAFYRKLGYKTYRMSGVNDVMAKHFLTV